jgi:hypothetical protein
VALMGRRMRERDDEDLALEQLEHAHDQDLEEPPSEPNAAGVRDASPVDHEGLARRVVAPEARAAELGGPLAQRARAIDHELASQPPWLTEMLGREPEDRYLQAAWQHAARQTAGWRIDHDITDPHVALGPDPGDDPSYHTLLGTISDTRTALELNQDRSQTIPAANPRSSQAPSRQQASPRSPSWAPTTQTTRCALRRRRPRTWSRTRGSWMCPIRSSGYAARSARSGPRRCRSTCNSTPGSRSSAPISSLRTTATRPRPRWRRWTAPPPTKHGGWSRPPTTRRGAIAPQASRARALEQPAEQLGWRDRRRGAELLAEARVQHQSAARAGRELADARSREQQLRDQRRHPDDWLAQHGPQAAAALAAERELAVRRERSIQAAADRAVDQPGPHIREAIGERPQQPGEQRERWDEIAHDLEQHRLRYQIDAERHGITGPRDAPERQHGAFQRQRDELSRRVQQLQADRGLEAAREPDAPDAGLDL